MTVKTVRLNAEYYENQGREYALADAKIAHKLAETHRAPAKADSWQSKAWERGYRAALDAMHHERCNAIVETQPAQLRVSNTGNAVREHIESLREMARVDTDTKRCARLRAKADKLDAKWFGAPEYPSTSHAS